MFRYKRFKLKRHNLTTCLHFTQIFHLRKMQKGFTVFTYIYYTNITQIYKNVYIDKKFKRNLLKCIIKNSYYTHKLL